MEMSVNEQGTFEVLRGRTFLARCRQVLLDLQKRPQRLLGPATRQGHANSSHSQFGCEFVGWCRRSGLGRDGTELLGGGIDLQQVDLGDQRSVVSLQVGKDSRC